MGGFGWPSGSQPAQLKISGLNRLGKEALSKGPDAFHRVCGNTFAATAVSGGEFVFLLSVHSKDEKEFEAVHGELKASAGSFGSASANFASSLERISSRFTMSAKVLRNGLSERLPDLTPEAFQRYALEFPEKLKANRGAGMKVMRYGLREYGHIHVDAPQFPDAERSLSAIADEYLKAQQIDGEFEYWEQHPDEFRFVDLLEAGAIKANREEARKLVHKLERFAYQCAAAPSKFQLPANLPVIEDVRVPRRLRWEVLPLDGSKLSLGVIPNGETRMVRLRGLWSPSGGDPLWEDASSGRFSVYITAQDGTERTFRLPTPERAKGGERVEIRLLDNPYYDNRMHGSKPASATLY